MQQAQFYILDSDYKTAIELLEPEAKKKNARAETFELTGDCYRALGDRGKAIYYYEKRIAKGDNNIPPDLFLHYGELLVYEKKYAAAKTCLQTYYDNTPNPDPLAQTLMASCDTAMTWMDRKDGNETLIVENLKQLNSKFHDWGAIHHNNGIIFISDRPRNRSDKGKYYTIYKSNYGKNNNLGSPALFFTDIQNTHMGPAIFTKDGKTIYYTQTNTGIFHRDETKKGIIWENKLEIKIAEITDDSSPLIKSFEYNNPSEYSVGHACLSPDDSVLYYVSDMPGGYGGTDIYYSVLEEGGKWTAPTNAGPTINTAGNEMFPTMDNTGVLYFSSNGRVGLGGLDIFRTKGEKNSWTMPENMNHPINSHEDDFYLILSPDKSSGFFASNRPGGIGNDDIYTLTVAEAGPLPDSEYIVSPPVYEQEIQPAEEKEQSEKMVTFTGTVTSKVTHEGIDNAMISFVNNVTKEHIICISSAGTFSITLDEKAAYTYFCIRENYVPNTEQSLAGNDDLMQAKGIHIEMTPIKMKEDIVIADNVKENHVIEYRVQVMAGEKHPSRTELNKVKKSYPQLKIIYESYPDIFIRVTAGQYKTVKEATKLKNELRALGYKDAFVVKFVNGIRKVVSYN